MKPAPSVPAYAFAMIAAGAVLGIAGADLVLPAVPSLPRLVGGTSAQAQYVLAAYVAGTALGLLLFGELGSRFDPRKTLVASLAGFALVSLAAVEVGNLQALTGLRFLQGAAGAAPAVFAPGFIRALYPDGRALRMFGLLGSVELLVPALAPILGAWLLVGCGWQASFVVLGALSLALAAIFARFARALPRLPAPAARGSYSALLRNRIYLRYALSQAFALGGLLVFVFGAPAVIVGPMKGDLSDFIWLQVVGIAFFILGANLTGRLVDRFGSEAMIGFGTALSALGALSILGCALTGVSRPSALIACATALNFGFGLRGPPGFLRAVEAGKGRRFARRGVRHRGDPHHGGRGNRTGGAFRRFGTAGIGGGLLRRLDRRRRLPRGAPPSGRPRKRLGVAACGDQAFQTRHVGVANRYVVVDEIGRNYHRRADITEYNFRPPQRNRPQCFHILNLDNYESLTVGDFADAMTFRMEVIMRYCLCAAAAAVVMSSGCLLGPAAAQTYGYAPGEPVARPVHPVYQPAPARPYWLGAPSALSPANGPSTYDVNARYPLEAAPAPQYAAAAPSPPPYWLDDPQAIPPTGGYIP